MGRFEIFGNLLKRTRCFVFLVVLALCWAAPVSAAEHLSSENEQPYPTFGKGPVEVRLYANYFCAPCRRMEPVVEPILRDLVENEQIRLVIVDIPLPHAIPYIRHYLYALNENDGIDNAFKIRDILFDIARKRGDAEDIQRRFDAEGIAYSPYDLAGVFTAYNELFKKDEIRTTPSAVIYTGETSEHHSGQADIVEALESLQKSRE